MPHHHKPTGWGVKFQIIVTGLLLYMIAALISPQAATANSSTPEDGGYEIYLVLVCKDCLFAENGFRSEFNGHAVGWQALRAVWTVDSSYYRTAGEAASTGSAQFYYYDYANFDYQVRLRRLGCLYCPTGLVARGSADPLSGEGSWHQGYEFQFTRDGTYSVQKRVNGIRTVLQNWTFSPVINQGDAWNTLRVVANGALLEFYINDIKVWQGSDADLVNGKIGISMGRDAASSGNELQVDWAQLDVIKP